MTDINNTSLILSVETSSRIGSVALARDDILLVESNISAHLRHSKEIFPLISELLEQFNCKVQNINEIYISIGPGSFTGLRIAVTMAKAMHLAIGTRVVMVDSLDVIASNVIDIANSGTENSDQKKFPKTLNDKIAVILDAKRGQFFTAVYQYLDQNKTQDSKIKDIPNHQHPGINNQTICSPEKKWAKVVQDCLMTAPEFVEQFSDKNQPIYLLGDGLLYNRGKFLNEGIKFFDEKYWSPLASKVHLLGRQKAKIGEYANPLVLSPVYLRAPQVTLKIR
jgi:tRNA threonylcarbamoyl adenosine modification protein YeaZ